MKRITQNGGFSQTAYERQLWLATTPAMKAHYRDLVKKEREIKGGSFKSKAKKVAIGTATSAVAIPVLATYIAAEIAKAKLREFINRR